MWSLRRIQALAIISVIVGVLLLGCVGYGIFYTIHHSHTGSATSHAGTSGGAGPSEDASTGASGGLSQKDAEDLLANKPLPTVLLAAAEPGPLSTKQAHTLAIPGSTTAGAEYVPSGFPQTPEGALAQLAAIETTAMQSMSIPRAQAVITAWAAPGGPTATTWTGVKALSSFLSSAGISATGTNTGVSVTWQPTMGFIKGTVGAGFVVPCIDYTVNTVVVGPSGTTTIKVADADCQRMAWDGTRWEIAAGDEPAQPPSIWPGTDASISDGYQWIQVAS